MSEPLTPQELAEIEEQANKALVERVVGTIRYDPNFNISNSLQAIPRLISDLEAAREQLEISRAISVSLNKANDALLAERDTARAQADTLLRVLKDLLQALDGDGSMGIEDATDIANATYDAELRRRAALPADGANGEAG